MDSGVWYGLGAYAAWGVLPIYWKQIETIPATQLIAHRITWSFLTLAVVLSTRARWSVLRAAVADRRVVSLYAVAGLLITINWLTYIWAVNGGFIVETSLGYFINPLVSVVLAIFFFGERLRPLQWLAVALAVTGVLYLTIVYGSLPSIAIVLALSFGAYGAVKKKAPLGSIHGLSVETGLLAIPAALYLIYADRAGAGAFLHQGAATDALLAGTGVVTTIPLLLFASGVQRTRLSTMGVLQYVAPTLQLLIGVIVYHEPFTRSQFVGFGIVWAGLVVFAAESVFARRVESTSVAV